MPGAMRIHKIFETLRGASLVLNETQEPKRMHQLTADHA
jgi:hypothetical protein